MRPDDAAIELSVLIPARRAEHCLATTCRKLLDLLAKTRPDGGYEILIACNAGRNDPAETSAIAHRLAAAHEAVEAFDVSGPAGKGVALKRAVARARGRTIVFADADLPFGPAIVERAARAVVSGGVLAVAHRRLPESRLELHGSRVSMAYRRHLLGLAFNRLVRTILPIATTDTQAGTKAMPGAVAREAFRRTHCPGFLFDLELFLCAATHGCRVVELPVAVRERAQPSTVRVARQAPTVLYWLARIWWRHQRGAYADVVPHRRTVARALLERI